MLGLSVLSLVPTKLYRLTDRPDLTLVLPGARYQNPEIKETPKKSFDNNFFLDG